MNFLDVVTFGEAIELATFVKAGQLKHSIDEDLYGVDVHSKNQPRPTAMTSTICARSERANLRR
jgi:hypothetical protein